MFKSLVLCAAAALVASGCALTPPAATPPAAAAIPAVAGKVKVQWLGQAAFKIKTMPKLDQKHVTSSALLWSCI